MRDPGQHGVAGGQSSWPRPGMPCPSSTVPPAGAYRCDACSRPRNPPLRRADLGAQGRRHHQLARWHHRLRAARPRVPRHLVAEHQHRRPEVLPRPPRRPRARALRPPDGGRGRRHHHPLGRQGRLLRRRRRRRAFQGELTHLLVNQKAAFNSRSGSTSGSRRTASARRASSCRSPTPCRRSSTGTSRRA